MINHEFNFRLKCTEEEMGVERYITDILRLEIVETSCSGDHLELDLYDSTNNLLSVLIIAERERMCRCGCVGGGDGYDCCECVLVRQGAVRVCVCVRTSTHERERERESQRQRKSTEH